ncbi:glycosyltransferase family 4 protein [Fibrella forsythiae]|uniref:Glycosyltransferase family 4 protein n=1 Tax=Fibrella forsythiae TaxID=2817061 RepID=A0ABS3JQZ8_9BACT|nr:glycosyltransferase family 4 protein [Fibrella forsythiae]MBO0952418.1 glycosyltransferase family 4 protein [Fibrella forsythiae]
MTILLIGHDANRAGAQLVLLQLMQQLKENGFTLHLLLGDGGPLLADYQQLSTVTLWPHSEKYVVGQTADKILGKLGLWQQLADKQQLRQRNALHSALQLDALDLVLVNTVTSGQMFRQLPIRSNVPVLAFVHELAMSVQQYTNPDDLRYLLQRATRILAVSRATAQYYETAWQVSPSRITLFTHIDLPAIQQALDTANHQAGSLPGLDDLPANALIVGGCGNAEWRKGTDLFVSLARLFTNLTKGAGQPAVYFVWVGLPPGQLHNDLALDAAKAGLGDRIRFVAPTPAVLRYMARFDLFLLCSREDPYPLVMLEAGLSGVPVVCFNGAGGAAELVETDGGIAVPYLDLLSMAQAVQRLVVDADLRRQLGKALRQKIQQRHNLAQSTSQFLALVSSISTQPEPLPQTE